MAERIDDNEFAELEKEFEKLSESAKHGEFITALSGITTAIKEKNNEEISALFKQNAEVFSKILTEIKSANNAELEKLAKNIEKGLKNIETLLSKPKRQKFIVKREYDEQMRMKVITEIVVEQV